MNKKTIDDYNKRISSDGNSGEENATKDGGNSAQTYYDLARDQEYETLFDKEVQLENAKQQALKYTQNQINAGGFGNTGYGSSLQTGTYNAYLNKVGEARSEYAQNIKSINAEEKANLDAEANDRFESITTMLTQASTQEQMDKLLADYGYLSTNEDGSLKYDENGGLIWNRPEGMSDDDWYQIQYYYNLQKDALSGNTRPVYEYSGDIVYYGTDGTRYTDGKSDAWNEENATMNAGIKSGEIPSGSYIAMQNMNGNGTIYIYYENGKTYYVTQEEFNNNSGDAYYIYGKDKTIHRNPNDIDGWK